MGNPITDGQLESENPGVVERLAAAAVTVGIIFMAYELVAYPVLRLRSLFTGLPLAACLCVCFPEFIVGLSAIVSTRESEVPAKAVRMVGWALLALMAIVLGCVWLSTR